MCPTLYNPRGTERHRNLPALVKLSIPILLEARDAEPFKSSNSVRMTDSVQNLLLALRLKSENTEDAPEPPILRARVPGVDSAASGDGACARSSSRSGSARRWGGRRMGAISPAVVPRRRGSSTESWELKSGDWRPYAGGTGDFGVLLCSGLRRSRSDTTHIRPD
jgi:hypothetical protein